MNIARSESTDQIFIKFLSIFGFILGLLSCMRFISGIPEHLVAIVPLSFFLVFIFDKEKSLVLAFMAVACAIDKSGNVYSDTPSVIRYFIYIAMIFALCRFILFDKIKLFFLVPLVFYIGNSFSDFLFFEVRTFVINFFIYMLFFLSLCLRMSGRQERYFVVATIAMSLGIIFAECFNILLFSLDYSKDYLSYSPLKFMICALPLFFLSQGRLLLSISFSLLVLFIFNEYGTRIVSLLLIFSVIIFYLPSISKMKSILQFFLLLACLLIGVFSIPEDVLVANRVLNVIYYLQQNSSFYDFLFVLDPVRLIEHKIFLERDLWSIALGDGLGSALIDSSNQFGFVTLEDHAFSEEELNSGVYYRIHDAWLYLGLRFGLIAVFFVNVWLLRFIRAENSLFIGALAFICLNSATFSILGLLVTTYLIALLRIKPLEKKILV